MDDTNAWQLPIGARPIKGVGTAFRVWAPKLERVAVRIVSGAAQQRVELEQEQGGYFSGLAPGMAAGDRYLFVQDGKNERPDPASRFQPDGVHAASQVVDPEAHPWQASGWQGLALDRYVLYELHVGTFTPQGTFSAVIPRLEYLRDLGVTAIELMPVAQFPGTRNWGYDGVCPFAPHNSYGGPEGLKRLVDACHAKGLAVVLDVVYNHLGPDGNYLDTYGHYFTDRYRTPWGSAVNFDGPHSDAVCDFFTANTLYWLHEYRLDALRLDAVHGIYDFSAHHILRQIGEAVQHYRELTGRLVHLIAESDLNDARVIAPRQQGGHGMDAQWNDDFHHALHALLTGERQGYYQDFGDLEHLAAALDQGYVYAGQFSRYRQRRHGNSAADRPPRQFVVFSQNHDQVGNRMNGDRLAATLAPDRLMLAAGLTLTSPYLPLIFMGEEYGETAPFQYFVSHADPALVEAIRRGRQEEFAAFAEAGDPPDPQDEATFLRSKIDPELREAGHHRTLFRFYRRLLEMRRSIPALRYLEREGVRVVCHREQQVLVQIRSQGDSTVACLYNFSPLRQQVPAPAGGEWQLILDSTRPVAAGGQAPASSVNPAVWSEGVLIPIEPFGLLIFQRQPGGASDG